MPKKPAPVRSEGGGSEGLLSNIGSKSPSSSLLRFGGSVFIFSAKSQVTNIVGWAGGGGNEGKSSYSNAHAIHCRPPSSPLPPPPALGGARGSGNGVPNRAISCGLGRRQDKLHDTGRPNSDTKGGVAQQSGPIKGLCQAQNDDDSRASCYLLLKHYLALPHQNPSHAVASIQGPARTPPHPLGWPLLSSAVQPFCFQIGCKSITWTPADQTKTTPRCPSVAATGVVL
jgi:hypothetical protein